MANIIVRPADIDDLNTIAEFNQHLALETEGKPLEPATIQQGVGRLLQNTAKGRYFVAVCEGRIVGQVMFTREWSDWRNGDLLWIQSVYVLPKFRRQGVFRRLLKTIQELVQNSPDIVGIRLYVEQHNTAAQATYRKLGFTIPGYLVMESLSEE